MATGQEAQGARRTAAAEVLKGLQLKSSSSSSSFHFISFHFISFATSTVIMNYNIYDIKCIDMT